MVRIDFGDISLDATDFEIDNNSDNDKSVPVRSDVKVEWDLSGEEADFFKDLILNNYTENLSKCRDCEHLRFVYDEDLVPVDFECGLGASREEMLGYRHCLLVF